MPPLGNNLFLTALQRLQTLLKSGNHCIDTEAEFKFYLDHRYDSIDTPMEINEWNEWIDDLINKMKNYNPEVVNNPELKTAINDLINELEAAGRQNGPRL